MSGYGRLISPDGFPKQIAGFVLWRNVRNARDGLGGSESWLCFVLLWGFFVFPKICQTHRLFLFAGWPQGGHEFWICLFVLAIYFLTGFPESQSMFCFFRGEPCEKFGMAPDWF